MKNIVKIYLKIKIFKISNFNKFCFFFLKYVFLIMNLLIYFLRMISDVFLVNSRKSNFMLIIVFMDLRIELKVYILYRVFFGISFLIVWYFWFMLRIKFSRVYFVLFFSCWGRFLFLLGCNNLNIVLFFYYIDYRKCSFNDIFCFFL